MMLGQQSRCVPRARVGIVLGMLSMALATGATTPVGAQTEAAPSAAQSGGTNAAPETGGNAEEAAPLLTLPVGRPFGFTHNEFVDLSETYETNPLGLFGYVPNGNTGADSFTALSLGIGLHDHTVRFTGDLQYTLTGDAYARNSGYDQLYNYLNALVTAAVIPDYLFVRASAFASPVLVNGLGPVAAPGVPVAGGINSGLTDTYGYTISPDLMFRLGNFARSDSILNQSAIFFVAPQGPPIAQIVPVAAPPSQFVSYSAVERISSGSDFNRLNWQLTGTAARSTEPGIEFQQVSGNADIAYAITRELALLATGGYEAFSSNQAFIRNISGPIALGGFRVSLGPRLQASFRAGEQFNFPSYLGDIFYQMTPLTTFTFSLTDAITTPAAGLLGNLGQLGVNNLGNFYNTNYQLGPNTPPPAISGVSAFNPAPIGGGAITDVISRYRAATASLVHIADRTQYRLTAFWSSYDAVVLTSGIPQQTSTGGELAVYRNINPFLTGGVTVDYFVQNILGGDFSSISGNLTLNYRLSALMQVYFRTAYIERFANASLLSVSPLTANVSDTAITVGVSRQF